MKKAHALVVSLLFAGAAAVGASATLKTVHLGAAAAATKTVRLPDAFVAERRRKLQRWAASLSESRAARPPALPGMPHYAPVVIPAVPPVRQVAASPAPTLAAAAAPHRATATPTRPAVVVRPATVPAQTTTHSSPAAGGHDDEGYGDDGGDD